MATATDIGTLITRTPGIHGGVPHIAGTGVTVRRIAMWYKLGHTPEEIGPGIGHLTHAQVYAALAYYHANRDEIEADIAQEEAEANRLEAEHTSGVPRRVDRDSVARYRTTTECLWQALTDGERHLAIYPDTTCPTYAWRPGEC